MKYLYKICFYTYSNMRKYATPCMSVTAGNFMIRKEIFDKYIAISVKQIITYYSKCCQESSLTNHKSPSI